MADPIITEPIIAEPIIAEPIMTEPITTEPIITKPIITKPIITGPIMTEPFRARGGCLHLRPAFWLHPDTGDVRPHDHPQGIDGYVPAHRDGLDHQPGIRWNSDPVFGTYPDPRDVVTLWEGESLNVKTTAGIDFLFAQGYSTTTGANGLNYIGLSNDALTENSASTTLSTEIAANGLSRAQGTYNHTAGQATCTVAKTFTATGTQSCQKAALFTASSSGTMNHALALSSQRNLINGDILPITFTITIS